MPHEWIGDAYSIEATSGLAYAITWKGAGGRGSKRGAGGLNISPVSLAAGALQDAAAALLLAGAAASATGASGSRA